MFVAEDDRLQQEVCRYFNGRGFCDDGLQGGSRHTDEGESTVTDRDTLLQSSSGVGSWPAVTL